MDTARVNLRPIASPVPLTFLGLMIASTIVSGSDLGWVPPTDGHLAGWAVLGVPFPLQILAAVWAFPARSAGAATGSAVLAGTWLGYGLVLVNAGGGNHPALGMMLAAAAAALLVPATAELSSALVPALVLFAAAARFGISAVYELGGGGGWQTASGWTGVVVAAAALYGALALELENTVGREVVPVVPLRHGKTARTASLEQQLESVANSPGVRKTL